MRAVIFVTGLLALSACGTTVQEDISSRSEFSPIRGSFFLPVDDQTRSALETSPEWADLVDSYQ